MSERELERDQRIGLSAVDSGKLLEKADEMIGRFIELRKANKGPYIHEELRSVEPTECDFGRKGNR